MDNYISTFSADKKHLLVVVRPLREMWKSFRTKKDDRHWLIPITISQDMLSGYSREAVKSKCHPLSGNEIFQVISKEFSIIPVGSGDGTNTNSNNNRPNANATNFLYLLARGAKIIQN